MEFIFSYLDYFFIFTKDNLFYSILIYFIFLFFYSVFSAPGLSIFIVLSGYLYGIYYSFLISIISITFGSLIFFIFSQFIFKSFFFKYYEKYAENINKYISNSSLEYLIIFRMIPGPPLLIQNLIFSLLNISVYKFIFTTLLGLSPIVFTFVFFGNKIKDIQSIKGFKTTDILTWDSLFFLFILIFFLFLRIKYKKRPSNK